MANLFFIHTPLQLLVAQQIIQQEQLLDNVLLYGYVDDNKHFLKIYDLTVIENLWMAKEPMSQVSSWAEISRKHIITEGRKAFQRYRYILKIIKKYQVNTLYLGDMKNQSCQLAALSFHKKGLRICFFEEGSGHYVMNGRFGIGGNWIDKVYSVLIDFLYYNPLYGIPFGHILYWKGFVLQDLPIDVRYSIVPFYHESFDRLIKVKVTIPPKLELYLHREIQHLDTCNSILLLTSPFYANGIDNNPEPYIKTIVDYAKSIGEGNLLHVKFHPRETEEVRDEITGRLRSSGVDFIVLGQDLNIPIEYYLQYVYYERIIMFLCSTSFYNGYLFPKTEFVSILPEYYNNCKEIGSINAKMIEPLLQKIPKQ